MKMAQQNLVYVHHTKFDQIQLVWAVLLTERQMDMVCRIIFETHVNINCLCF